MSLLILGLLEGGQAWAWDSGRSIGAFASAPCCFVAFVLVEQQRRRAGPAALGVLPDGCSSTTTLIALGVGVILIGLTSYVPTFLEALARRRRSSRPRARGPDDRLADHRVPVGPPLPAHRVPHDRAASAWRVAVLGGALAVVSSPTRPSLGVALTCFVVGLGLGLVATPTLIAAQSSVGWGERGVVTGANLFARSMGSAVGVAVLGAIANAIIAGRRSGEHDPATVEAASTAVFLAVAIGAVLTIIAGLAMPKARVEDIEMARPRVQPDEPVRPDPERSRRIRIPTHRRHSLRTQKRRLG